jgi:TolA-binding protein
VKAFCLALFLLADASALAKANEAIAEAARPLDEGVPEVAVWQLRRLAGTLSGTEAMAANEKLAESLLAAQHPAEALPILDKLSDLKSARLLRAQTLAALDRFEEALEIYRQIAVDSSAPERAEAAFGVAEMLRALGRVDEAIAGYRTAQNDARFSMAARLREAELFISKGESASAKRLLDHAQPKALADKRQKRLLRARVDLLENRPEKAIELLDSLVLKPEGASHQTIIGALFAIADAHLQLNSPESGDDYLEDFIDGHANDVALDRVFAKLDQVYRAERKPPRNQLEKWARDSAQPRRGFARWYLAQSDWRAGRHEEALRQFEMLRAGAPLPAALAPALLQFAGLKIAAGKFDEALGILAAAEKAQPAPEVRAQIEFESGRAMYGAQKFSDAASRFQEVRSAPLRNAALLNASLAWLQAGDARQVQPAHELAAGGDKEGEADLALERALSAAKRGEKKAQSWLSDFVRQFPDHPRAAEARLALAELAFHAAPPKLEEAGKYLAAVRAAPSTPETRERAAYLSVCLTDARNSDVEAVIASANEFLRSYPQSSLGGEVRMKLAESYFRRQDFANAQTQFETLAQENPKSPLTETALFLAAQSASASMASHSLERALELLTQVVKMKGPLRWAARNEQAAIERRLGKAQDAQVLYDEVLEGDAGAAEKDEALCGKADIFSEQAAADSTSLARAIALYDQLADETPGEPHWQNQALFKKGLCLEKETDRNAALATFYRVLEFNPSPDKPPEFFWYYKAGFNAARLLEEGGKWDSAAAVYEKLVAANGPRSEEAKTRLSQLRLEHFLWQN